MNEVEQLAPDRELLTQYGCGPIRFSGRLVFAGRLLFPGRGFRGNDLGRGIPLGHGGHWLPGVGPAALEQSSERGPEVVILERSWDSPSSPAGWASTQSAGSPASCTTVMGLPSGRSLNRWRRTSAIVSPSTFSFANMKA